MRPLVADLVADGAEATVAPTTRETVAAVAMELECAGTEAVTVQAIAQRLGIDKAAATSRTGRSGAVGQHSWCSATPCQRRPRSSPRSRPCGQWLQG